MPKDHRLPGILLELKVGKNSSPDELKTLAETALQQILDRSYDTEMKERGISCIYRYGVAFSGKKVEVIVDENLKIRKFILAAHHSVSHCDSCTGGCSAL